MGNTSEGIALTKEDRVSQERLENEAVMRRRGPFLKAG